jgi:aldose 1-epimerase
VGGGEVRSYTLANAHGMTVEILNLGGIIRRLEFPDRRGSVANIVLGLPAIDDYVERNPPPTADKPQGAGLYFGALVGRFANRLGGGRFEIEGQRYQVPANNGRNALHGGPAGFDQKLWEGEALVASDVAGVRLSTVSPDGDMGFPGTLTTVASYTLDNQNRLTLTLRASTDAPTVVNLSNHTYWNLAGEASGLIYDHVLYINADGYTPVDEELIPEGGISAVEGSAMDFRQGRPIGEAIAEPERQLLIGRGYDHNWVLNRAGRERLTLAASVFDPGSGRRLDVRTTQPGLQFYSGNFLDGSVVGSGGRAYRQSAGLALETQHFPDAPNQPLFPSTLLRPGEEYEHTTVYALSCS